MNAMETQDLTIIDNGKRKTVLDNFGWSLQCLRHLEKLEGVVLSGVVRIDDVSITFKYDISRFSELEIPRLICSAID